MATYAGLTYTNGNVPKSILAPLDGENYGDAELRRDAAEAWNRARADVLARTGITLTVRGWNRTLAEQETFFFERYYPSATGTLDPRWYKGVRYVRNPAFAPAAIPGDSNHGWGLAVDIVDFGAYGTSGNARSTKATPILERHGWTDDEGSSIGEPWHRVYKPERDTHPTVQEDDMSEAAERQIDELHRLLLRKFADGDSQVDVVTGVARALGVVRTTREEVAELHAGVAPRIDKTAETNAEKVTFRTAIKETRLAVLGGLNTTITNAVKSALAGTTGIDKAAITKAVTDAVEAAVADAVGDTEYVLTPKEN